ncbi:hypothetical protein DPMN_082360 [Dreissena polymorpha]|uniref:Uncharacterized protein n=1 Tax=Dreissena polymorpha TaxID=45954 RepID=A0A9D3Y813_DREPO|nr:hypothetical protein DPMN_082360 [Dreissena polymorpha]
MNDIRLFDFDNVLECIYKSCFALVIYFDLNEFFNDPKATGLCKSLLHIIPVITASNLVFQKETLDISVIQPIGHTTISKLEYLKLNDGHYKQKFKRLLKGDTLFDHELSYTTQQNNRLNQPC